LQWHRDERSSEGLARAEQGTERSSVSLCRAGSKRSRSRDRDRDRDRDRKRRSSRSSSSSSSSRCDNNRPVCNVRYMYATCNIQRDNRQRQRLATSAAPTAAAPARFQPVRTSPQSTERRIVRQRTALYCCASKPEHSRYTQPPRWAAVPQVPQDGQPP
jgi:hypothetical protein